MVGRWLWWEDDYGGKMNMVGRWIWWEDDYGGKMIMVGIWLWWEYDYGGKMIMVGRWLWWEDDYGGMINMVGRWLWWEEINTHATIIINHKTRDSLSNWQSNGGVSHEWYTFLICGAIPETIVYQTEYKQPCESD